MFLRTAAAFTVIGSAIVQAAKKVKRKLTGECKKCGFCCEHIPLVSVKKTGDPDYDRFLDNLEPSEWHDDINPVFKGQTIYRCKKHDRETGLCTDWENRPKVCAEYPKNAASEKDLIYKKCGYRFENTGA
jgi:Fe-S-cluster containining protein